MATKWGTVIDAAAKDRTRVLAAVKAGLEYTYTDEDGKVHKEPSSKPLRDAGYAELAAKVDENSASRGKSIAHSLNVVITRLSAPPAAKARLSASDIGAASVGDHAELAKEVVSLRSRVAELEKGAE